MSGTCKIVCGKSSISLPLRFVSFSGTGKGGRVKSDRRSGYDGRRECGLVKLRRCEIRSRTKEHPCSRPISSRNPFLTPSSPQGINLTPTPVIVNMSAQKSEFEELFQHISDPALVLDTAGKRVHACND